MYQIPKLLEHPGIVHAFSTVDDGDMSFNYLPEKIVVENRRKFLTKLGVRLGDCITMQQVHGSGVYTANAADKGLGMRKWNNAPIGDAMITSEKNLFLMLKIADCAPVIIYDHEVGVVALVHVGWKGADLEIVVKTINSLREKYKSKKENLIAVIGPAARKESFTKENPSQIKNTRWKPFLEQVEGNNYKVDFVGLIKKQLEDCGVEKKNTYDCGIDTVADKCFFSHYRDSQMPNYKKARFVCVVGIR